MAKLDKKGVKLETKPQHRIHRKHGFRARKIGDCEHEVSCHHCKKADNCVEYLRARTYIELQNAKAQA